MECNATISLKPDREQMWRNKLMYQHMYPVPLTSDWQIGVWVSQFEHVVSVLDSVITNYGHGLFDWCIGELEENTWSWHSSRNSVNFSFLRAEDAVRFELTWC
jgi:hypothetical protein